MAVSVHDSLAGVALGQALGAGLAVDVVLSASVVGEVCALVDKSSTLGVGTGGGSIPEGTAEVDMTEAKNGQSANRSTTVVGEPAYSSGYT